MPPSDREPARPNVPVPPPRRRFRLERLEERVAPAAHYNPQSKLVGTGGDGGGSSNTITSGSGTY